uniref:Myosin motor domain-containing protein n=1 Tax=Steinernema glaseri TaxID=37863 RepID=A0A1I7YG55_9BILA
MSVEEVSDQLVWAPDAKEGFVLASIVDLGADEITVQVVDDESTQIIARYDAVFPAEDDLRKDVDDNCALMYLNEGTLLNNCRMRYARGQIYTYVANILISINPYESIPELYSQETIRKYQGKSLGALPPHIFAIADKAYRDMKRLRESQSVIVSGESGAGKTESQKCILRYLCENWGSAAGNYLKSGCTQFFGSSSSQQSVPQSALSSDCKSGGFLEDSMVDDFADFQRLSKALEDLGIQVNSIFDTIAALLHLGNVRFVENTEDSRGGCMIDPTAEDSLATAAQLLGLNDYELRNGLVSRMMQPTKGGVKGSIIMVPLKMHEANAARDALAKAIYSRLFDFVVASINQKIPFGESQNYIGLYAKEGLNVPKIEYSDNQDCIDLFEMRPMGLLDILDEESKLPRPTPQHFTAAVHETHAKHIRLTTPRKSKLREDREMRDDEGFIVKHYAGSVCYQTALFLEKNNDALHQSLEFIMEQSETPLLQQLFKKTTPVTNGLALPRGKGSNKLSVASGTHFVRCIKPNEEMKPGQFEGARILSQLKCAGMISVLKLMQKGYPSRTMFADLYAMYKSLLPPRLSRLDARLFCKVRWRPS